MYYSTKEMKIKKKNRKKICLPGYENISSREYCDQSFGTNIVNTINLVLQFAFL
jgi:hypothetical protein